MVKQDNFEDNLFLLLGRIKLIRDTLMLDMDPALFMNKTLDDISFVHQILDNMLKRLQENKRLINRDELFNHLSELDWQFSQVLSEILNNTGSIGVEKIPAMKDQLTLLRKNSQERRETVESIAVTVGDNNKEPVMSSSELHELLKDF